MKNFGRKRECKTLFINAPCLPKREANTKACLQDGLSKCGFIWIVTSSAARIFEHNDVRLVLLYLTLFLTNLVKSALQEGLCYMALGLHGLIIHEQCVLFGAETLF